MKGEKLRCLTAPPESKLVGGGWWPELCHVLTHLGLSIPPGPRLGWAGNSVPRGSEPSGVFLPADATPPPPPLPPAPTSPGGSEETEGPEPETRLEEEEASSPWSGPGKRACVRGLAVLSLQGSPGAQPSGGPGSWPP